MSISSPKQSKGTRIQNTGTGAGDHEEDEPTETTARETWHRWTESNQRDEKVEGKKRQSTKIKQEVTREKNTRRGQRNWNLKDLNNDGGQRLTEDPGPEPTQRGWIQTQDLLALIIFLQTIVSQLWATTLELDLFTTAADTLQTAGSAAMSDIIIITETWALTALWNSRQHGVFASAGSSGDNQRFV